MPPDVPAEIQALLQPGETVCAVVADVLAHFSAGTPFDDAPAPYAKVSLYLTTTRLVVAKWAGQGTYILSTALMTALHERPYSAAERPTRPYQAYVYLSSRHSFVFETPKQNMAARAQELSQFLNLAFAQLAARRAD